PPKEGCANRKSGADGCEQHKVTLLQSSFFTCRLHGERNCAGCGVTVAINIDDYAFRFQPQSVGGGFNNSLICLMRNKAINVTGFTVVPRKQCLANLSHLSHREFEYCLAILMYKVHLLFNRFVGCRM